MCLPHFEHPLSVGETAEKSSQVQIVPEIVQCNTIQIRYALKEKNDIIWEFFPNVGPLPTPPFWEPLIQKQDNSDNFE